MPRILAVADEPFPGLPDLLQARPDVVVSCGDIPWDDLERIVDAVNVPLLFVPGNHDPSLKPAPAGLIGAPTIANTYLVDPPGPRGCTSVDGRVEDAGGVRIAGLGGSIRYRSGPNQYTQVEMERRVRRLLRRAAWRRVRDRRGVDVVIAHSPPRGLGDEDDRPHEGFDAFHRLIRRLRPRLFLHGHIHPYGVAKPDRYVEGTRIVNVVPYKVIDLDA
jgi:calcineurin-like phosphoesterase family protein